MRMIRSSSAKTMRKLPSPRRSLQRAAGTPACPAIAASIAAISATSGRPPSPPAPPNPPSAPPDSCSTLLGRTNARHLNPPLFCFEILNETMCNSHYFVNGEAEFFGICHWVGGACNRGSVDLTDCNTCTDLVGRTDTRSISAGTCIRLNADIPSLTPTQCESYFQSFRHAEQGSDVRMCIWTGKATDPCQPSPRVAGCSPSPPPPSPPPPSPPPLPPTPPSSPPYRPVDRLPFAIR